MAAACLAGCGAAAPVPLTPEDVEPGEPWPAAFAVSLGGRTLLVPVAPPPEGTVPEASGTWLLDEDRVVHAEARSAAEVASVLACGEGVELEEGQSRCDGRLLEEAGVLLLVTSHDLEGTLVVGPSLAGELSACGCFEERADEAEAEETDPLAEEAEEPEGEPCEPARRVAGPVSLLGGTLYVAGVVDDSACGGEGAAFHVEAVSLADGAEPGDGPASEVCVPGVAFDDWSLLDRPCPRRSRREACAPCSAALPEAWVPFVWSGQLVELGLASRPGPEPVTVVRSRQLSPELCPSPADPCGSAEGFVGLDGADAYWIASDETAALVLQGERLVVLLAGLEAPIWDGVEMEEEILGVRYHQDATALREAMERASSSEREEGRGEGGEARGPGFGLAARASAAPEPE